MRITLHKARTPPLRPIYIHVQLFVCRCLLEMNIEGVFIARVGKWFIEN